MKAFNHYSTSPYSIFIARKIKITLMLCFLANYIVASSSNPQFNSLINPFGSSNEKKTPFFYFYFLFSTCFKKKYLGVFPDITVMTKVTLN